jgi:hypothetical protein
MWYELTAVNDWHSTWTYLARRAFGQWYDIDTLALTRNDNPSKEETEMTTILLMLATAVLAIAVYRAVPAIYYSRRSERMIAAALADPNSKEAYHGKEPRGKSRLVRDENRFRCSN